MKMLLSPFVLMVLMFTNPVYAQPSGEETVTWLENKISDTLASSIPYEFEYEGRVIRQLLAVSLDSLSVSEGELKISVESAIHNQGDPRPYPLDSSTNWEITLEDISYSDVNEDCNGQYGARKFVECYLVVALHKSSGEIENLGSNKIYFPLDQKPVVERIAKAVNHLIKLNGGGKKEAF